MKIFKLLKKIIFSLLLVAAILFAGLRLLGFSPFNIETKSMEPNYPVYTLVYVKNINFNEIKKGDVITYINQSGSFVTHRITSIDYTERSVRTKGDANEFEDIMPTYEENIVGKVYFKIPYLGKISSFITEKFENLFPERSKFTQ